MPWQKNFSQKSTASFTTTAKRSGEVDFLIEHNGAPLPMKVKNGKDYTIHSALNNLLSNTSYNIPYAYVLTKGNVYVEGRIIYLPIYMLMFINESPLPRKTSVPDLSSLSLDNIGQALDFSL